MISHEDTKGLDTGYSILDENRASRIEKRGCLCGRK